MGKVLTSDSRRTHEYQTPAEDGRFDRLTDNWGHPIQNHLALDFRLDPAVV